MGSGAFSTLEAFQEIPFRKSCHMLSWVVLPEPAPPPPDGSTNFEPPLEASKHAHAVPWADPGGVPGSSRSLALALPHFCEGLGVHGFSDLVRPAAGLEMALL